MKTKLNPVDRSTLEFAYHASRDKRQANKINVLLLHDDGYELEEIAAILRFDKSTIFRQIQFFEEVGISEYLKSPFKGGVCKLSLDQTEVLKKFLDDKICGSTDEVIAFAVDNFNISYTRGGMSALLGRLGFVFKKPTLIPGKSNQAMQEAFVEYYNYIKSTMTANDKMFFLDGVHPQHNSSASGGWIRKGLKKPLQTNTGRQRINLNGALDTQTGEVIIREDKTINSNSTIALLKMIEQRNPNARKIVVIVDNAPYYFNSEVVGYIANSRQLEMVYLPPYSPNLNLIERVWGFMKKKVCYNQYYEKFSDFKDAIGDFFQNLPEFSDELDSLLEENFHIFSDQKFST
jgi:transposase